MKEILLTRGLVTVVDDEDYDLMSLWRWYAQKGRYTDYAARSLRKDGRQYTINMHRLLMNNPVGMQVDHKDGNGLNNRRSNLRVATKSQNQHNHLHHRLNKSGFRGVHFYAAYQKWRASIKFNGEMHFIGYFDSSEKAAIAYDEAASEMLGEFAALNFPLREI